MSGYHIVPDHSAVFVKHSYSDLCIDIRQLIDDQLRKVAETLSYFAQSKSLLKGHDSLSFQYNTA